MAGYEILETMPTRRFSADEYDRMLDTGVLDGDDPTELIDGLVVTAPRPGDQHTSCVAQFTVRFGPLAASGRATLNARVPLRLSSETVLEPDIALLEPSADLSDGSLPKPGEILLIVEVADTSLRYDRSVKLPLYAAAGIPEAWLAVLGSRRRLEVFREPEGGKYRFHQVLRRDATIAPLAFPDLVIPVRAILG